MMFKNDLEKWKFLKAVKTIERKGVWKTVAKAFNRNIFQILDTFMPNLVELEVKHFQNLEPKRLQEHYFIRNVITRKIRFISTKEIEYMHAKNNEPWLWDLNNALGYCKFNIELIRVEEEKQQGAFTVNHSSSEIRQRETGNRSDCETWSIW